MSGVFSNEQIFALSKKVKERLSEYRFSHVEGVVEAAIQLGELYMPEFIDELRVAALLHDITKEFSVEQHIELLKKHSVPYTDSDVEAEPLLHSKTAEFLVRDEFFEFATEKICQSLRYHTTGSADMTLFDAIIYIADYIESGRTVEFCVCLKNYFWAAEPIKMNTEERIEHLWKTVLLSLDMTVENIIARGGVVDNATLAARDAIRAKLKI